MRRYVSITKQNIIKFIPLINFSILFIWIYNYSCSARDFRVFRNSLFLMFGICVPVVISQILLIKLMETILWSETVINILSIYVVPLLLGHALVKYQEKVL